MTANFLTVAAAESTIVAGVSGKSILVQSLYLIGIGAVPFRFKSGASGTVISGELIASGSSSPKLPFATEGYFQTAQSQGLFLLSDTNAVSGFINYVIV